MAGRARTFGGLGGVALVVSALVSGCGDSDSGITSGGGGTAGATAGGVTGSGATGAFATAGEPSGGSGGSDVGGESGGAAGETAAMGGAAGAPTPSNEAGAGGEAPNCSPLRAGPHCEFKKFQPLYANTNFDFEQVVGLSRDGRYVTTTSTNPPSANPAEAHRISVLDGTKDILMPPQATNCTPTAISEDGSWVAGACLEGSSQRPFYWTKSSGAVYYDPALGIVEVHGRSADAQVLFGSRTRSLTADGTGGAGGADNAPSNVESVFRWGADGSFLSGSDGPPRWAGWASSVLPNRDGSRVIINAPTPDEFSNPMVYRWSSPGTFQPMTVHSNNYYDDYFATDVARDRDVTIGVTETCDSHGCGYFPVIWDQTRVANYVEGDWPGGVAAACNRDCSVIAGDVTREVGPDYESGPGLWTNLSAANADHVVKAETHFLIELLGASTQLDGWSLGKIVAMSDDGKVIAGNGRLNGTPMGWVIHL